MPPTKEERREALKDLYHQARACTRCPQLASTRTTVVFGSGNADADLMFVGEAPGKNEDEQGLPFVGQAGKLLDKLLGEIGMQRADVFICNVLKCRPPGNRDPAPVEIEAPFPREIRRTNIPDRRDDILDGSLGFKFRTPAGIVLVSNVVVPLNSGGMRPSPIPTFGLEYSP